MQEIQMARKTAAYKIHMDIMAAGEVAAESFSTFCRLLKTMRDDKLYAELEYSSFEAYCENAVGLKHSQAYAYIKALEDFGEENSTRVEKLGIKKLKLLGSVPKERREEFMSDNNIEEMTSRQVEAAVKEYKDKLYAEQKARHKTEQQLEQQKDHVTKTNKYADEHMIRARDAEFKLEKQETAMAALRADLKFTKSQLTDAKNKGEQEDIKCLQDTILFQVDKLEKLEDENEKLQKQLHDKPIEVATRTIEKVVIPDEVAVAIYNKISSLYEGLAQLTVAEIQIFSEQVDPHFQDSIHRDIKDAISVLDRIDAAVTRSQNEK